MNTKKDNQGNVAVVIQTSDYKCFWWMDSERIKQIESPWILKKKKVCKRIAVVIPHGQNAMGSMILPDRQ